MTTHEPSKTIPRRMATQGFARNTLPVMGPFAKRAANALNHIVAYRRKCVFSKCVNMQSIAAGLVGTTTLWRGRFHAGHGASKLVANIGAASPDNVAAAPAEIYLTLNAVDTGKMLQSYANVTDAPDNYAYGRIVTDITEDTTYDWTLVTVSYGRPFSLGLWVLGADPVDTANGGTIDPRVGQGSSLLDSRHQDMHVACTEQWERNGSHLFGWCHDTGGSVSLATAAYTNLFDGTSTGGAGAAKPGLYLETNYHNSLSHDVPIILAAYAYTVSSTGKLHLVDDGNNPLAEITTIDTTPAWRTVAATLAAGTTLSTIEVKNAGFGNTVKVEAVSIYEYL